MAHWKTMVGNRTSFDVADLGGKPLLVQIESARGGEVEGFVNGRKVKTPVVQVRFVGHERPLGMKATSCKAMVTVYGNGDVDTWAGKWIWLYAEIVDDPSQGRGGKTEAVRIRPIRPTEQEIAAALAARGGKKQAAPAPPDDAADQALVAKVCAAIEAATDAAGVEAAIAPHREEIKAMDKRYQAIVASAKKVQLDAFKQPAPPAQEGAADVAR